MEELINWQTLTAMLSGVYMVLSLYCGIKYVLMANQRELKEERFLLLGIGIFFALSPLMRISFNIIPSITLNDHMIGHYFMGFVGLLSFIFIERSFNRTKFIISISFSILLIFSLFDIIHVYVIDLLVMLILLIFLFWMVLISDVELQNIGLFMIIGVLISLMAMFFETPGVLDFELKFIIARSMNILSVVGFLLPTYYSTNFISRINPRFFYAFFLLWDVAWTILGVSFLIVDIFILINSTYNIVVYLGSLNQITLILLLLLIRKNRKMTRGEEFSSDSAKERINVLELFTKPQQLTEEEVSVAKERGVCLVCKNEIIRETYVCPECKSYYCLKCSKTLTRMENACWVCQTPFDDKKPVNKMEQTEHPVIDLFNNKSIKRRGNIKKDL